MTCACRLCGVIVRGAALTGGANGIPASGDLNRPAFDFQALMQALAQHIGQHHPDYINVLAGTANTYHLHLIAKLGTSFDPAFEEEREHARRLCYWTLAGDMQLDLKT